MSFALDSALVRALTTAVVVAACGGDSTEPTPSNELQVGGTYNTTVTLQQSACTGITVQTFPTTVTHTAGSSTLTLTHAGNAYSGAVQRNGSFATTPKAVGGGGETHTFTIAGTFTTTSMDATVTAVVQRTGQADCTYSVKWAGPKQGPPNVIPG
jgi:hypothetical protein